jgi:hypothetical protein
MRSPPFLVIRYKTLLMQRLLDSVRHGYHRYTAGTVPAERALALCAKFDKRYGVALNVNQRNYRKKQGQGNARLLLADLDKNGTLHWFLLVSAGVHAANEMERLHDALNRGSRIRVTGYELLELTREKNKGGGVRLTWRMTDEAFRTWHHSIRAVMRASRGAEDVTELVRSLYQTPGFGATRVQVGKLVAFLRGEWIRAGRDLKDLSLPGNLPYVRRIADQPYAVTDWLREQEKQPDEHATV